MRKKTITKTPGKTPKWLVYSYWLIPCVLFFVQYLFTTSSMTHIRYEEVAESIRNPYWLKHGFVTDGVSSNIGWYGTLASLYKVFGFSLFSAKVFRLVLHLVSLFALAELLRRWMGVKYAVVPLVAAGLSPVWLYFNTFQASFGVDLQYLPVILLILLTIRFSLNLKDILLLIFGGILCMVACMSYPSFLLYLPFIFTGLFLKWLNVKPRKITILLLSILIAGCGLLLPLFSGFLYVKNHNLLIYDQRMDAGMFRGGGKLDLSADTFYASVKQTFTDLTVTGKSYYFDLPFPDLSGYLAQIAIVIIVICGFYFALKDNNMLFLLVLISVFTLFCLVVPALSSNYPGLRRGTGIIAGIYAIYSIAYFLMIRRLDKSRILQILSILLFLLVPYSNLLNLKQNLEACAKESPWDDPWFKIEKTPAASLEKIFNAVKGGAPLACFDGNGKPGPCRYYEIFAVVAGNMEWNELPIFPVKAFDWKTGKEVILSIELWQNNEFP